ncbi:MAG: M20 family metallo-hydrolase [Dysgonamonadaceae bacterium]|jgi:acetylornithine deacetylase|nr:M20 family metallo-hydrolase [Dysgonamonadaceae bacterium]
MNRDTFYYDAIDLLKELIAIPSFSREETEAADYLENFLKKMNYSPQRKGNNIWLSSPDWDDNKKTILLNSHIDTVKPAAGWTRDPFAPEEDGDCLFGLGSNDAGASLVSLLMAFFRLTQTGQPNNFIFLASCEEEVSGKNGIESVLPELPRIDWGVIGEPTQMQPAVAERGLMVLDAIVRGKAGHAARNEGDNAIYRALPVIEWFRNTQFPRISAWLGPVQMTVTMIQAGTQHNVIPGECKLTIDIRSNDCYSNKELFEQISLHCGCEISARSLRLNASNFPLEHPLVQRAILLGMKPFGSPTLSDQALLPFPSLKIGPGDSARSHTPDEYILKSEIREAIDLYFQLFQSLNLT